MAPNGNSDIYVMDLGTRIVEKLTSNPAIETAPSYSPDGTQIAFESGRSGGQQIYVMDAIPGGKEARSVGVTVEMGPRYGHLAVIGLHSQIFIKINLR